MAALDGRTGLAGQLGRAARMAADKATQCDGTRSSSAKPAVRPPVQGAAPFGFIVVDDSGSGSMPRLVASGFRTRWTSPFLRTNPVLGSVPVARREDVTK